MTPAKGLSRRRHAPVWARLLAWFGLGGGLPASSERPPDPTEPRRREAQAADTTPSFDFAGIARFDASLHKSPGPKLVARVAGLAQCLFARIQDSEAAIPAMPARANQALSLLDRDDSNINELVQLLSRDPGTTAKIVALANSPLYRGETHVDGIRDAVVRVGTVEVRRVVAAEAMATVFKPRSSHAELRDHGRRLWRDSIVVARGATWLALSLRRTDADRAFLAGLLHNAGMGVALDHLASALADAPQVISDELVARTVDAASDDIGEALAQAWGLPAVVAACCALHRPLEPTVDATHAHLVRVVAGLHQLRTNPFHRDDTADLARASADALGLGFYELRALATELGEIADQVATVHV